MDNHDRSTALNSIKTVQDLSGNPTEQVYSTNGIYQHLTTNGADFHPMMKYLEEAELEMKCLAFDTSYDFTNPEGDNHCVIHGFTQGAGLVLPSGDTSPSFQSAGVRGATVTLGYNESLLTTSTPASSDYVVTVAGSIVSVSSVQVSGSSVLLTLTTPVTEGQSVTVAYTPGTNPVKDLDGNNAIHLSSQTATNTTDSTAPVLVSFTSTTADGTYGPGATVNITATYDDTVTTASTLTIALNTGASVTLATTSNATTLTGTYTVGATGSGQNSTDLTVASITSQSAVDTSTQANALTTTTLPSTNIAAGSAIVVDTTAPTLTSVEIASSNTSNQVAVAGDTITLTFVASETLSSPTATINGSSATVVTSGAPTYTATYTATGSETGTLAFEIMTPTDQYSNAGASVTATTDSSAVTVANVSEYTTTSTINVFDSGDSTSLTDANAGFFFGTVGDLTTGSGDSGLADVATLSGLASSAPLSLVKEAVTFTSATTPHTIVLTPTDRSTDAAQDLFVVLPSGVTMSTTTNIDPPTTLASPTISGQDVHAAIGVPTGAAITFSGGSIELCMSDDALSGQTASSVSIYTSSDSINWSADSAASGQRFTSGGQFCFTTNHLTSFAATTTMATSSGGGGGGGGSSSRAKIDSALAIAELVVLSFTKDIDPESVPDVQDFAISGGTINKQPLAVILLDKHAILLMDGRLPAGEYQVSYSRGVNRLKSTRGQAVRAFSEEFTSTSAAPAATSTTTTLQSTNVSRSGLTAACYLQGSRLEAGARSQSVRDLQQFLVADLNLPMSIDGAFGPRTEQAVRIFQQKYASEILAPLGFTNTTGIWPSMTEKKAKQVAGCA